jgi:hypothetical protein
VQVTIKTRILQKTGYAALLCIENGVISVAGGAELDNIILSIPLQYAELNVVQGHDSVFELNVKTPDAKRNGIFVVLSVCSARDRCLARSLQCKDPLSSLLSWLEACSYVGVKIEGNSGDHVSTVTMAYRNSPRPWATPRIRLTSDSKAEFDQFCSNDEPGMLNLGLAAAAWPAQPSSLQAAQVQETVNLMTARISSNKVASKKRSTALRATAVVFSEEMPLKQEAQTQLRAYRNPPRPSAPSAPSRVRLTSEAEVDRLCSNDEPDRRPLKREAQTQLRAYSNPPRPWAPSSIRFTSEAEFDRLCSNDELDARPLKRETQTRLRAIIENLMDEVIDSKKLLYITFILAVTLAHAFLLVLP